MKQSETRNERKEQRNERLVLIKDLRNDEKANTSRLANTSNLCNATRMKMGLSDNDACTDCGETDTVHHMLYECQRGEAARWRIAGPYITPDYFQKHPDKILELLKSCGRLNVGNAEQEC